MRARRLTPGEIALARQVFGCALNLRRVWLVTGAPTGGWAIALFGLILFPDAVDDFASRPPQLQAWLIHELTHAWQFQHRPWWTLSSWARTVLTGGYLTRLAYRYALPYRWEALNLEQQAKVIEHRFLLTRGLRSADMPEGATPDLYPPLPGPNRPVRENP